MAHGRDTRPPQPGVRRHRGRLREQELLPMGTGAADARTDDFKAEASRQSALVAASPYEAEDQAFVDAASSDVWSDE